MFNQKEIAGRLKLARIKKGYKSARSFSKLNNLAESTYAQHESGKRKLNTTTLLHYSEKLSVNPGWILTGQEPIFLDRENLDSNNSKRYIIANVPKISVVLKMLIPFVMNGHITREQELYTILLTLYNDTEQYNLDLKDIKDTLTRLIKNIHYENSYNNLWY